MIVSRAGVSIRPFCAQDAPAACHLVEACPEAARWQQSAYERVEQGDYSGWIAPATPRPEDGIAGFILTRQMAGELEILNLAVDPAQRRRGIATALLDAALAAAQRAGARAAFLEVRASNRAAIAFYRRHGFHLQARRPHYYSHADEGALVLSRKLA